jgi:hypothetical protein
MNSAAMDTTVITSRFDNIPMTLIGRFLKIKFAGLHQLCQCPFFILNLTSWTISSSIWITDQVLPRSLQAGLCPPPWNAFCTLDIFKFGDHLSCNSIISLQDFSGLHITKSFWRKQLQGCMNFANVFLSYIAQVEPYYPPWEFIMQFPSFSARFQRVTFFQLSFVVLLIVGYILIWSRIQVHVLVDFCPTWC